MGLGLGLQLGLGLGLGLRLDLRELTAPLYLQHSWTAAHGGCFRMFTRQEGFTVRVRVRARVRVRVGLGCFRVILLVRASSEAARLLLAPP